MNRRLAALALTGGLLLLLAVAMTGGDDPYVLEMRMANAEGLTDGSPVTVGGVEVGTTELEPRQDHVLVRLRIDPEHGPVDRGTTATILARNALGHKQVLLASPAEPVGPAPDGAELPTDQVEASTDLDQLLSTLDPDTRTRLAVLLNEGGMTFAGRKLDLRTLLEELAPALAAGGDLLGEFARDNAALRNVLDTSDRVLATLAEERRRMTRMIDRLGRTTETVAARRVELRETLGEAPRTLRTARRFLGELRAATAPLGSTARHLEASAEPLQRAIEELEPFRASAAPTLAAARDSVPSLTRLASRTGRSLDGALPALDSVKALADNELDPVGRTLDNSIDNLLATVDNWAHAIQFSDGLGHVFRGEASIAPSFFERFLAQAGLTLDPPPAKAKRDERSPAKASTPPRPKPPGPTPDAGDRPDRTPPLRLPEALTKPLEQVEGLVGSLLKPAERPAPSPRPPTTGLLDFLLEP